MALTFPIDPSSGEIYQSGSSATYKYNGEYWIAITPPIQVLTTAASSSYSETVGASITEPIEIRSTGGAITKPTNTLFDYFSIVDDGSGWCNAEMKLNYTDTTGVSESAGNRLYKLPGGYSFDSNYHGVTTTAAPLTGDGTYPYPAFSLLIPTGYSYIVEQNSYWALGLTVVPYNSTEFRVSTNQIVSSGVTQWAYIGSTLFSMTVGTSLTLSFRFRKG